MLRPTYLKKMHSDKMSSGILSRQTGRIRCTSAACSARITQALPWNQSGGDKVATFPGEPSFTLRRLRAAHRQSDLLKCEQCEVFASLPLFGKVESIVADRLLFRPTVVQTLVHSSGSVSVVNSFSLFRVSRTDVSSMSWLPHQSRVVRRRGRGRRRIKTWMN